MAGGDASRKRGRGGGAGERRLQVAFVGCGNIATYHLDALFAASPRRADVAVCIDPSAERARRMVAEVEKRGGAPPRVFASLSEAVAADPGAELFDACDVMVPAWETPDGDLHELVATEAIRAGRHVLLEKPVAVTRAAAERIVAAHAAVPAAERKVLMVAENAGWWPEVLEARELVRRGEIGDVLCAYAKLWESAMGEWASDYAEGSWRCDDAKLPSAGFTFDSVTHFIRPLRIWLGDVESVAGVTAHTLKHMPGASRSHHILRFKGTGTTATLESVLAPAAISDQPFFRIQGTKGEVVLDGFAGGGRMYTPGEKRDLEHMTVTPLAKKGWDAGYVGEYAGFAAACIDGVPIPDGATVRDAVEDLKVAIALFRASETRQWVDVDSVETAPKL